MALYEVNVEGWWESQVVVEADSEDAARYEAVAVVEGDWVRYANDGDLSLAAGLDVTWLGEDPDDDGLIDPHED